MNLNLTNKTAVVTGASRGIGLATVRTLIDEGVRVVGGARTITPELKETGAYTVSADLSTAEGVSTLIDSALTELGGIDMLVNNVGGADGATVGFLDVQDTEWSHAFDMNVLSTVRATRAAPPSLIERRGAIVNISSIMALMPGGFPPAMSSVKAAITAIGKALSEEFGPQGVRVNTVSPGLVNTSVYQDPNGTVGQWAAASGMSLADFRHHMVKEQNVTTGRMTEPEEVAALTAFLLSDVAGNITGADYVIDGGTIKAV
ncbi:putative oxidoreductase [Kibdelosporangium banguiense]|uniref:Oxidoreductase n=1 Tax=Kibdelosporangium banguiense TaxID=1365924 RepID=A0ABS4TSZ8_9PSEU|nr:SDR family oxidoreductase [Kibdelosporangium banguiense]MBP2327095.1 putative oxidoreductase [Kibdelosporangium banguiense]